jgi:hypothetical protein
MAQLDSDAIKSNFSKKTNHYWGVQGLLGLGLPDHKLVAEGYPNPNHLSPKAIQEIFSAYLHTSTCHQIDRCTVAAQLLGEFTYYLRGIFLLFFFFSLLIAPSD